MCRAAGGAEERVRRVRGLDNYLIQDALSLAFAGAAPACRPRPVRRPGNSADITRER